MVLAVYQLKRRGAIISLVNIIPGNINSDHPNGKVNISTEIAPQGSALTAVRPD